MGEIIKKKKPRAFHIVRGRKDPAQKVSCMKESWHENVMHANFIFMHGNLILSCMTMTLLYENESFALWHDFSPQKLSRAVGLYTASCMEFHP